ncbi:MAG: MBL fold metallo-hydrolase [Chloroflexi bacterium]|nr:MBL fold metallo-hydrolase [Chloroflexota bacterium]
MPNDKLTIGNVEITSLSDGVLEFDLCNFFPGIPEEDWKGQEDHLSASQGVSFNLACFLIKSDGHTIAVDTGLGPKLTPETPWGELLDDLKAHGMQPEDVDMVVNTHAHRDHIGWNLISKDGKYTPTFPNAQYYLSATDWEACHDPALIEERFPNAPECVWPLEDLGVLNLMEDGHKITSEITTLATPGHTPGHMSLMISSQGENGLVLGDVLHNTVQIENTDWVSRADIDPEQTRITRRNLMDRLEREGIPVAAVHLARPGFGKIVREQGRRFWQVL